jgi:hypothetical protein
MLIIKPTIYPNLSNLFLEQTLHVSDSSSFHHQEFITVHTAIHTGFLTANDGQSNCPKHVEFYSKNKFEKLGHIVGFIIIILSLYFT